MVFSSCAIAALLLGLALGSPTDSFLKRGAPVADTGRALQVRQAFSDAWDGYYAHAFPHDTLLPLTGGNADDR